jgi:hypothetical protein
MRAEKKLDSRVLLAFRQFPRLAGRASRPGISTSKNLLDQGWMVHLRESVHVAKTLRPSRKSCRTRILRSRSTLPTDS